MAAAGHQLPIRIVSRRLVKASDPSIQPHTAAVSNIDLYNNTGQFSFVCLYPNAASSSFDDVVAAFAAGLPSLINHFYVLSGSIAADPSSGRPELRCHNQGADLVVGEVAGAALGSLDFRDAESLKMLTLPFPDDVALSVQLLSFACGRFAVVWGINHLVTDVFAAAQLVTSWSEMSRSGTVAAVGAASVSHNRSAFFPPRSPPSYGAAIGELLTTFDERRLVNVLTAHDASVERLYCVEAADLDALRVAAATATRAEAVSAYLWKALAGVAAEARVPGERCRMGWWVDARRRLATAPSMPKANYYFGNATAYALGDAAVEEVRRKPLAEVAAMVREAVAAVDGDGEYVQEISDWVEEHREEAFVEAALLGLGAPTLSQTEFASSSPIDTDFGFGQAVVAMPVFHYTRMSSGLMAIGARPAGGDGAWFVSACVWPRLAAALEADERRIFKPLTADYLGLN